MDFLHSGGMIVRREFSRFVCGFPRHFLAGRRTRSLVAGRSVRPHDSPMAGVRGALVCACAAALVLSLSSGARAAPAPDGPAYGVEPGEAPKNSVGVGASAGG